MDKSITAFSYKNYVFHKIADEGTNFPRLGYDWALGYVNGTYDDFSPRFHDVAGAKLFVDEHLMKL